MYVTNKVFPFTVKFKQQPHVSFNVVDNWRLYLALYFLLAMHNDMFWEMHREMFYRGITARNELPEVRLLIA